MILLEKELQKIGYEIFDIVNDFLIGMMEIDQKEKLFQLIKEVPVILNKRRCT